jgi:hemerythrin superfamily protein
MNRDENWLIHDHRKHDEALEDCMSAADASDWKTAVELFNNFVEDLQLHMRMEDEVLYPLLRQESNDADDSLALLGYEHDDIVRLLRDLAQVIKLKNFDHFEESLEPLHKAMVEHNDHEEIVFMSLGTESVLLHREEIIAKLEAISPQPAQRDWSF